jgi:hypothetical protein
MQGTARGPVADAALKNSVLVLESSAALHASLFDRVHPCGAGFAATKLAIAGVHVMAASCKRFRRRPFPCVVCHDFP